MSHQYSRRTVDFVRTERIVNPDRPWQIVDVAPKIMIVGLDFPERIIMVAECNEVVCET